MYNTYVCVCMYIIDTDVVILVRDQVECLCIDMCVLCIDMCVLCIDMCVLFIDMSNIPDYHET